LQRYESCLENKYTKVLTTHNFFNLQKFSEEDEVQEEVKFKGQAADFYDSGGTEAGSKT
jgi:hypothetical protein